MNLSKTNTILAIAVSACVLMGTGYGIITKVDSRYASATEVEELWQFAKGDAKRLEKKLVDDEYNSLQKQIWDLELKYPNGQGMDEATRKIYQDMKIRLERLLEKKKKLSEVSG